METSRKRLPREGSLTTFDNSKNLLEELTKLYIECEPNCEECEGLIYELNEHIRTIHVRGVECLESVLPSNEDLGTSGSGEFSDLILHNNYKNITSYEQLEHGQPLRKRPTSHSIRKSIKVSLVPFKSGGLTFPSENKNEDDQLMQQDDDTSEYLSDVEYKCEVELLADDEPFRSQDKKMRLGNKSKRSKELERTRSFRRQRLQSVDLTREEIHLSSKANSTKQRKSRRKPGRHICSICKIEFPKARCLFSHFEVEHKNSVEKPYQCNLCDKTYASLGDLNGHCKSSHPINKPHVCGICLKEFSMIGRFKIHMRSHTGERPYTCEICGMCFVTSGHLAKHIRTHTGEKPHHCEICGKRYAVPELLTIHKRTHTGEKPFMCDQCSKCFTTNRCLKNHIKIHQGLKAFVCEHCGKAFTLKTTLQIHSKIHAGEKRVFTCDICGEKYPLQNQLNSHKTIHISEHSLSGQTLDITPESEPDRTSNFSMLHSASLMSGLRSQTDITS